MGRLGVHQALRPRLAPAPPHRHRCPQRRGGVPAARGHRGVQHAALPGRLQVGRLERMELLFGEVRRRRAAALEAHQSAHEAQRRALRAHGGGRGLQRPVLQPELRLGRLEQLGYVLQGLRLGQVGADARSEEARAWHGQVPTAHAWVSPEVQGVQPASLLAALASGPGLLAMHVEARCHPCGGQQRQLGALRLGPVEEVGGYLGPGILGGEGRRHQGGLARVQLQEEDEVDHALARWDKREGRRWHALVPLRHGHGPGARDGPGGVRLRAPRREPGGAGDHRRQAEQRQEDLAGLAELAEEGQAGLAPHRASRARRADQQNGRDTEA
mmetsp:Transcript_22817/g.52599  ORF Transcript_22817/g.52599 Transcript_22817/m.52599 type:complete len:328 (-) Transcript_22817:208-1191(-)